MNSALVLKAFGDMKRGDFVFITQEKRLNSGRMRIELLFNGKRSKHKVTPEHYFAVPDIDTMTKMLVTISPDMSIIWHIRTGKFVVTSFDFGHVVVAEAPVFKQGKVVKHRTIETIRHVDVSGTSTSAVIQTLFRKALSGKLRKKTMEGTVCLKYDRSNNRFHMETI